MPIITVEMLTEGTIEGLGVRPDQVRVIIHELPKENLAVGGQTYAELQGK